MRQVVPTPWPPGRRSTKKRAVCRMPSETFHLLWYQGLKQHQAAELLGVTERTVKNRWRRARLLLQQKLHYDDSTKP